MVSEAEKRRSEPLISTEVIHTDNISTFDIFDGTQAISAHSWGKQVPTGAINMDYAGDLPSPDRDGIALHEFLAKAGMGDWRYKVRIKPKYNPFENVGQVVEVSREQIDTFSSAGVALETPANFLWTRDPQAVLLCFPADCITVALAGVDKKGKPIVGLSHSSWHVANAAVLEEGLRFWRDELGVEMSSVVAGIAPHISAKNMVFRYEDAHKLDGGNNWRGGLVLGIDAIRINFLQTILGQLTVSEVDPANIEAEAVDTHDAAMEREAHSHRLFLEGIDPDYVEGRIVVAAKLRS